MEIDQYIPLIIALLGGGGIGAVINHIRETKKIPAEIEKIYAERDKTKAETEKIYTDMKASNSLIQLREKINQEEVEEIINRVILKISKLKSAQQSTEQDSLYTLPRLSPRLIYVYSALHEIKKQLQWIVFSVGGGWAGCSMADFGTFFNLAQRFNLINNDLAVDISNFYEYSRFLLNNEDLSDLEYLRVQYLASDLHYRIEEIIKQHRKDGVLPFLENSG